MRLLSWNRSLALAAVFVGCGGTPAAPPVTPIPAPPPPAAVTAKAPASEIPPPGAPKPMKPAEITTFTSKASVKAIAIASHEIPVVHCRIMVRAGNSAAAAAVPENKRAGLANLVAEWLKEGGAGRFAPRELADRVDALGSDLSVEVGPDRAVFGLSVTRDKLDAALEVLGAIVSKPRFDAGEFKKLKARELDRVRQSQKGSGSWMARSAMYRELYGKGHPYADVDANDESLEAIKAEDAKTFYQKLYVAPNMMVVVAGDFDQAALTASIDKHVSVPNKPAPAIDWPMPAAAGVTRVVLARKPESKQADILVGMLAMERSDARWPELALAVHSLGGGMSARLFVDVREKRSLAYSTSAMSRELAHGSSVIALYAGTQTPLAPKSVTALLENLAWISGTKPIDNGELTIARTSLETGFLFRLETIGAVGGLAIDKEILGLAGTDVYDHVAKYREALRAASLDRVRTVATESLAGKGAIIAVAGDPSLAASLRRFGPVRVVDPEKAFATVEELTHDPNASLDVLLAK